MSHEGPVDAYVATHRLWASLTSLAVGVHLLEHALSREAGRAQPDWLRAYA